MSSNTRRSIQGVGLVCNRIMPRPDASILDKNDDGSDLKQIGGIYRSNFNSSSTVILGGSTVIVASSSTSVVITSKKIISRINNMESRASSSESISIRKLNIGTNRTSGNTFVGNASAVLRKLASSAINANVSREFSSNKLLLDSTYLSSNSLVSGRSFIRLSGVINTIRSISSILDISSEIIEHPPVIPLYVSTDIFGRSSIADVVSVNIIPIVIHMTPTSLFGNSLIYPTTTIHKKSSSINISGVSDLNRISTIKKINGFSDISGISALFDILPLKRIFESALLITGSSRQDFLTNRKNIVSSTISSYSTLEALSNKIIVSRIDGLIFPIDSIFNIDPITSVVSVIAPDKHIPADFILTIDETNFVLTRDKISFILNVINKV